MPLFGAHLSIAGGLHKAVLAAKAQGMETVQLFTASPQSWQVKAIPEVEVSFLSGTSYAHRWEASYLTDEQVAVFRRTLKESGLRYPMAHDSYLINLASPDEEVYLKSLAAFIGELRRAEQLGLSYLVTHPGAHVGSGEELGLKRVALALDEVHARCKGFRVRVLLETTAGQGSSLGHRFEHLARILSLVSDQDRFGVCLDTCHVFAAGYALAPATEYKTTMRAFDKTIGLKRLLAFHVNDSLKPLGSLVDRHAHIGRGQLGLEPFRLLVNDRRFRNRPMVLETPKEEGNEKEIDAINLRTLRRLIQ
jgi:deoxyribonuclease-4